MRKSVTILVLALLLFAVSANSQPRQDAFWITVGPGGNMLGGGGTGFGGGEWYLYPSGWINEWFYDHPFDPTRGKIIHIEFDWMSYQAGLPTTIVAAINWSTPAWSQLGYGPTMPPLPSYPPEELYIARAGILSYNGGYATMQHFSHDFIIWPYNPEWISIDVRGSNFIVQNGVVTHDCTVATKESSWGSIKANYR